MKSDRISSVHFQLKIVANGVYAAIAREGGAAIGNAGIVDLGDRTLVFDTFLTPQAAVDLRTAALEVTGRMPQLVINSHYHNDHIWGNQIFVPEAEILSSTETRRLIASSGEEEFEWYRDHSEERLAAARREYEKATDEREVDELALTIGYYSGLVEAYPTLEVCLPTLTFAGNSQIHGRDRVCHLITYEGGHTGSDTVLLLPDDGLLFAADLLFVDSHPWLADGDPLKLRAILIELGQLSAPVLVPGHGPLGAERDLEALIAYIDHCLEVSQRMIEEGKEPPSSLAEVEIPEPYGEWVMRHFYAANLRFLHQRLAAEGV